MIYKGTNTPERKLSDIQVQEVRESYHVWSTPQKHLAEKYGVSKTLISQVINYHGLYASVPDNEKGGTIYKDNPEIVSFKEKMKLKALEYKQQNKSISQISLEYQKEKGIYNPNDPKRTYNREYMREYRKKKKAEDDFKRSIFHT